MKKIMNMKRDFWPNGIIEINEKQTEAVKEIISGNINDDFTRRTIFSKHNTINWYLAARNFAHENPHLNDALLLAVFGQ